MTNQQPQSATTSQDTAQRVSKGNLLIDKQLFDFIEQEVLPVVQIDSDKYWQDFADIVQAFTPRNRELLAKRDQLQQQIDDWHKANPAKDGQIDREAYRAFLQDIGYLQPQGEDFSVDTQHVDDEIAHIAAPQLVVPVRNARYALNAANARWGSLYDALYGTDAISEDNGQEKGKGYNPTRGAAVIAFAKDFLDKHFALQTGSYTEVTGFAVQDGKLVIKQGAHQTALQDSAQFVGYTGEPSQPSAVLLKHNGLHAEIQIDAASPIGKTDPAGIKDVLLEAAVTTIQDCEDSVAAVDAEEKTEVYRNWFGLMTGELSETFDKNGKTMTRTMQPDRQYTAPTGEAFSLPGRSLMLIRNVGHLMTNPAILVKDADGQTHEIYEGIMDALITPLCALPDLRHNNRLPNSRTGSMYIVKPKMHGVEEVEFTVDLFAAVERALGLAENTLKIGIMDEERRTSANLKACIRAARHRVIFINTGFMDRTGDEMHTSMQAGAFVRKNAMKNTDWLNAYERQNVRIGVDVGLAGKAQIGKGMWAQPDNMHAMLASKGAHPKSGATCAWVPSPTGATLHAIHYHDTDVFDVLANIQQQLDQGQSPDALDDLLTIPLAQATDWSDEEIAQELDNNIQGILGYVVRWVDQGIGCSKVPDIDNVGLMEDRATLRISSQHVANWLLHGIVTAEQVDETLQRMAKIVDQQNAGDPNYRPMAPNFDGYAYNAARDLIFLGTRQPSGYTEPLLHRARLALKRDYA